MKYFFILNLLVVGSLFSNAQNLDILDLMTLSNSTSNDFNQYAISNGYAFKHVVDEEAMKGKVYMYGKNYKGQFVETYLTQITRINNSYLNGVEIQTTNVDIYKNVQNGIKKYGFEFLYSENEGENVIAYYRLLLNNSGYIMYFVFDPSRVGMYQIVMTYTAKE